MTKRRTTTIPRRTMSMNIADITIEGDHLVLLDWDQQRVLCVRISASPWAMEYLAEKCVGWLRKRRDEANLKITAIAGECAK